MNPVTSTPKTSYWLGIALALATSLFLAVVSAGIGIIGADGDPANLMYGAVLAIVLIGAIVTRFRPIGLTSTMIAAALAQAVITGFALIRGLGQPYSPPLELIGLNGGFIVMWLLASWLFRRASQARSTATVSEEARAQ